MPPLVSAANSDESLRLSRERMQPGARVPDRGTSYSPVGVVHVRAGHAAVAHALMEPLFPSAAPAFPSGRSGVRNWHRVLFASMMVLLFLPAAQYYADLAAHQRVWRFWRVGAVAAAGSAVSKVAVARWRCFYIAFVVRRVPRCSYLELTGNAMMISRCEKPLRCHGSQLLLGLVWAVRRLDLCLLSWLAPIVFLLILSLFVSRISSRSILYRAPKRCKLPWILEEYSLP